MSYSQSFTFHVSGSLSYPASQHGGTVSYSDSVHVNLHVDTSPFDASVGHCKRQIDVLTASVAKASVELCNTRKQTARMISKSILGGFFSLIRSELSQQKTLLATKVPMLLNNLKMNAEQCVKKQDQMGRDFERITSRYADLFRGLDSNLVAALKQLDSPLFKLSDKISDFVFSDMLDIGVSFSTLGNMELAQADAQLTVASIKKTALSLIQKTYQNLENTKILNSTINYMLCDESPVSSKVLFTPVVLIEGVSVNNRAPYKNLLVSEQCPESQQIKNHVSSMKESLFKNPPNDFQKQSIDQFLKQKISDYAIKNNNSTDTKRIIDEMIKIWQSSQNALIS